MMRRWGSALWVVLLLAAAFGLYRVKYRVQAVEMDVARVSQQLQQERESLRVADAEWAYLTRPERLQRLSARYLPLAPVQARQVEAAGAPITPASPLPITPASASLPEEGE